jgi:transposase
MDGQFVPSALVIHLICWTGDEIVLDASGAAAAGVCPTCGTTSGYVHDRYIRQPRDLPWRGRRVRLRLIVRRFRCLNDACPRRTFAERFDPVLRRYAHFTAEAEAALLHYGHTSGGEVGAFLAVCSGVRASADTLLRLLRRSPTQPTSTPRVLGIDEFSLARRHRYATCWKSTTLAEARRLEWPPRGGCSADVVAEAGSGTGCGLVAHRLGRVRAVPPR